MNFAATLASNSVYRILNTLVVFITTVVLSRFCGPEGYGNLSLLILNVGLINLVTSVSSEGAITYQIASGKLVIGKAISFIYLLLLFQFLAILAVGKLGYLINEHYSLFFGHATNYFWVGVVFLLSISLNDKYVALLNGYHQYTLCNKLTLTVNSCLLIGVIVLSFLKPTNYFIYIQIYVGFSCLQALISVGAFHFYQKININLSLPTIKELLSIFSYSSLAFFANLIQLLAYRIDFWLVNFYKNESELGLYSLSVRIVQLFWILPVLYASIIFPKVSSDKNQFDPQQMLSLIRVMNVVNLLGGTTCFLIAPFLIPMVFGERYVNGILPFQILIPGVVFFCITTILASFFAGIGKLKRNVVGSLLCFLVVFVLDILFIPWWGIVGAALASSVGYTLTTFYFIAAFERQTGHTIKELMWTNLEDWKRVRLFFLHLQGKI